MTIPEILKELEPYTGRFPMQAMRAALAQREAITPELLRVVEAVAQDPVAFAEREDYMLHLFRQSPYTTPSVAQCEEIVGGQVLNALIEQGRLVRLNEEVVFMTETYEQMRDRIVAFLRENERITVAQVRDLFGASRKYALALANYLDEKRITRRVGDDRVLR